MINTDYSCNYFVDFHEKFSNYYINNTSNIIDLQFDTVFQNLDFIFPKEQVNSLYVSSGVKNVSNNDFLEPIFNEIIEKMIYKIYYFKNVYLVHFIRGSEFFDCFLEDIEINLTTTIIKYIRFEHQHKNCFYLDYDYKIILIEIFKRVYSSLDFKVDINQIINEIKRLQNLSIQSEEFSFLNDIIIHLRNIKTKHPEKNQLDLKKVQNILNPILDKWFVENYNSDVFKFITGNIIEICKPFKLHKPVQFFYFFLFFLKDFNLTHDEKIKDLIVNSKSIIHVDGININIEALHNARHRYKNFDFSKPDNKRSAGCIDDLNNLKKSLSEIAL